MRSQFGFRESDYGTSIALCEQHSKSTVEPARKIGIDVRQKAWSPFARPVPTTPATQGEFHELGMEHGSYRQQFLRRSIAAKIVHRVRDLIS